MFECHIMASAIASVCLCVCAVSDTMREHFEKVKCYCIHLPFDELLVAFSQPVVHTDDDDDDDSGDE